MSDVPAINPGDRTAAGSQCPPDARLSQFLDGAVSEALESVIEEHLGTCQSCRVRFDELSADARQKFDRWASLLNDAPSAGTVSDSGQALPRISGYTLERELGRGGMGIVFLATEAGLDRRVALKLLPQGILAGPDRIRRVETEARTIARLNHPNIIHIHEVFEHDGVPCLALEYIDGPNLASVINNSPQPADASARIVEQIARAVSIAHRAGVLHRDLKPANILLDLSQLAAAPESVATLLQREDSPRIQPKLSDFGLAKGVDGQTLTATGEMLGTPRYMAPELLGEKPVWSPQADVYSLGVILYELLSGKPPFQSESLVRTLNAIQHDPPPTLGTALAPRDLETICQTCLAKDPAGRYRDADALADDLQRFGSGRPILARPVGVWERVWKWARRRPALAALTVVSALGLATLLGLWARFTSDLSVANVARKQEATRANENLQKARAAVLHYLNKMRNDERLAAADLVLLRRDMLQEACELYEALVPADADPQMRWELSQVNFELARMYNQADETDAAVRHFERSAEISAQLVSQYPTHARISELRQNLASSLQSAGALNLKLEYDDTAAQQYDLARRVLEQLVHDHPANAGFRWSLCGSRRHQGDLLARQRRFAEAERALRDAAHYGNTLPHISDYIWTAALAHLRLSEFLLDRGQPLASREHAEVAWKVGRSLRETSAPMLPRYRLLQVSALRQLAELDASDDPSLARQRMTEAIRTQERLTRNSPDDPKHRSRLAGLYADMAVIDSARRDAWTTKAQAMSSNGWTAESTDEDGLINRVEQSLSHGDHLFSEAQYLDAENGFRSAVTQLQNAGAESELVHLSYGRLARALERLGRFEEAAECWDQAVTLAQGPLTVRSRVYRCRTLVACGRCDEAWNELQTILSERGLTEPAGLIWTPDLEIDSRILVRMGNVMLMLSNRLADASGEVDGVTGQEFRSRAFALRRLVLTAEPHVRASALCEELEFLGLALMQLPGDADTDADHLRNEAVEILETWISRLGLADIYRARFLARAELEPLRADTRFRALLDVK